MPRANTPPGVRWKVFARDGFRCRYCGAKAGDAVLVVDHQHPVALGGRNNMDNLISACEECNQGKSDRPGTVLAELTERMGALDIVLGWLGESWSEESGYGWIPDEETLLFIISHASNTSEAEAILRSVAARLRDGSLRPGATASDVSYLLCLCAQFVSGNRHHAECYGYEVTKEEQAKQVDLFWSDPLEDWTQGMLVRSE